MLTMMGCPNGTVRVQPPSMSPTLPVPEWSRQGLATIRRQPTDIRPPPVQKEIPENSFVKEILQPLPTPATDDRYPNTPTGKRTSVRNHESEENTGSSFLRAPVVINSR